MYSICLGVNQNTNMSLTSENLLKIVVGILLFIGLLTGIGDLVFDQTNTVNINDSFELNNTDVNLTLTGNNPQTIISVDNGSLTVPATNYTDYLSSGFLQVDDNTSFVGNRTWYVAYVDRDVNFVGGAAGVLVGLITLFLVIWYARTIIKSGR